MNKTEVEPRASSLCMGGREFYFGRYLLLLVISSRPARSAESSRSYIDLLPTEIFLPLAHLFGSTDLSSSSHGDWTQPLTALDPFSKDLSYDASDWHSKVAFLSIR